MVKDFKEFLLRGNLLELAVAVVIGVAFTDVINALVKDLVTPLIAAIGGQPNFSGLFFDVHNSRFLYGDFVNALLSFVIVAAVLFFLVIRPVNHLLDGLGRTAHDDPVRECPECLSKVPVAARRCAYCTSAIVPESSGAPS
ncbi:MAG TPA: large conductance mechanosensitive channel protein MscL [Acidimicrobiales bacterium]|nr:large conductance mechanosensitive channel protein MscL [Acidimicrobiales bacterium]